MRNYHQQLVALQHAIVSQNSEETLLLKQARHEILTPATRLAVYQDGYKERLQKATYADYPALAYYAGEEQIQEWISAYVALTPSRFWDLNWYSIGFLDYIRQQSCSIFLKELAALESAIAEVFWLPESDPVNPTWLQQISLDTLPALQLKTRTASKLLECTHAVDEALSQFRSDLFDYQPSVCHNWLCVYRHRNEVRRYQLTQEGYALLVCLNQAANFGEALELFETKFPALLESLAHSLSQLLADWIENGILRETQG